MQPEESATIKGLVSHVKEYVNTSIDLGVYTAADKTSTAVSKTAVILVLFSVAAFFLLFLSISLALLLGKLFGDLYLGFLSMAVFFLLSGFVLWKMKDKWIRTPVADSVIKFLFKTAGEHEKN